ncbi:hypothetical protein AOQ84DRAFT_373664 [Glonium stellatum]|uniref:Uncharacterized protein n=1 Tax=Glonium stellatum TaxID=574774 RepID=A0A8E2F899_9PEZI|nr:hypothetical protein AOQ84DRAFT_373664 [Glonium stellatum]
MWPNEEETTELLRQFWKSTREICFSWMSVPASAASDIGFSIRTPPVEQAERLVSHWRDCAHTALPLGRSPRRLGEITPRRSQVMVFEKLQAGDAWDVGCLRWMRLDATGFVVGGLQDNPGPPWSYHHRSPPFLHTTRVAAVSAHQLTTFPLLLDA